MGIKINIEIKVRKDSRAKYGNKFPGVFALYVPPQTPAIRFPKKLAKNQHPIINERNFFGASFDTSDNPMGDRQSSDNVMRK